MAKFIKAAAKKTMLKVVVDGQEKWATCTPQVLGFTKQAFKGGEEVDIQSEATGEVGFHITRISKTGQGGGTNPTSTESTTVPKCADCGKVLKDGKYKKCYECNQKNPVKKTDSDSNFRTTSQLRRDEIGHMVSRTLIALTGQIDRNSVTEVMEVLYKKYQELVG